MSHAPRPCCSTFSSEGDVCISQQVQGPPQGCLVQRGSSRSPGPRALPGHQPTSKPAESATLTHTQSAFPGLPFLNGHINYCPFFLVIIWNTFFFFFRVFIFSWATTEIKLCSNPRDRTSAMQGHVNGKSSGRHLR